MSRLQFLVADKLSLLVRTTEKQHQESAVQRNHVQQETDQAHIHMLRQQLEHCQQELTMAKVTRATVDATEETNHAQQLKILHANVYRLELALKTSQQSVLVSRFTDVTEDSIEIPPNTLGDSSCTAGECVQNRACLHNACVQIQRVHISRIIGTF